MSYVLCSVRSSVDPLASDCKKNNGIEGKRNEKERGKGKKGEMKKKVYSRLYWTVNAVGL